MKLMIHTYNVAQCRGFIALVAVLMLALGTFAFSISTIVSATLYSDMVYAREMRIQKKLDQESCQATFALMKIKDYFLIGESNCEYH